MSSLITMADGTISTSHCGTSTDQPRQSALNKQKEGFKSSKKSDVKSSKKSDISANTTSQVHCVCSSTEDVGHIVECESCCQWSHCKCVSLSPSLASSNPFVCPFRIKSLCSRLSDMESEVASLSNQLASLESATDSRCQSLSSDICEVRESLHQVSHKLGPLLGASAASDPGVVGSSSSQSMPAVIAPSGAFLNREQHTASSRDRSCNLVVFGVPECPQGTRRTASALQDQDSIVSALSPLCSSFSAHSIRDMFRLGKNNRERSRQWTIVTMDYSVKMVIIVGD